jgi:hypothetical protein
MFRPRCDAKVRLVDLTWRIKQEYRSVLGPLSLPLGRELVQFTLIVLGEPAPRVDVEVVGSRVCGIADDLYLRPRRCGRGGAIVGRYKTEPTGKVMYWTN